LCRHRSPSATGSHSIPPASPSPRPSRR
jgi:hypothetical protein